MLASADNDVPVLKSKSARRRRIVMPLVVAAIVTVIVLLLAGAGQHSQLIGTGSTLAQPLIERSAVAYRNRTTADNPALPSQTGSDWSLNGAGIDYEPVGSLGGIMRLADPEVDFAVSDYPLSQQAIEQRNAGQFPIAIGSIAIVHNLNLGEDKTLHLDGASLARIYLGQITRWNDPALTQLNPALVLPDQPINAVHRSDGSGTTFGFTGYLAAGSREWASGPGTGSLIDWPAGRGAERSSGLIAAMRASEGSLGYVERGQTDRAGLYLAQVKNAAGTFTEPNPDTMQAAISDMEWSGEQHFANQLPQSKDPNAYPVTVAIYVLLERDPTFQADTRRTLAYLRFLVEKFDGTRDLGYLPLPAEAASAVQAYWTTTFSFTH